jgi:AraC-like DNA-binding protein
VDNDLATETLGIEFSPRAAYRFFRINFNEIHNRIFSVSDIFDRTGIDLIDLMNGSYSIQQKLDVIQNFLLKQLYTNPDDQIFEYCIDSITKSKGTIPVKELERKTGYSSRWLNMKFNERIGVSPKGLASIIRFSQYYGALLQDREKDFFKNSFYALYYDQSHFIKDFKRFTGLTPTKFEKQINDFGKIYYLD